jgi:hypothetical protein
MLPTCPMSYAMSYALNATNMSYTINPCTAPNLSAQSECGIWRSTPADPCGASNHRQTQLCSRREDPTPRAATRVPPCLGFRVSGFGFRVSGFGFRRLELRHVRQSSRTRVQKLALVAGLWRETDLRCQQNAALVYGLGVRD